MTVYVALFFFNYSIFIYLKKTCFNVFIFLIFIYFNCATPLLYKDKYIPLIPCIPYGDTDIPTVW